MKASKCFVFAVAALGLGFANGLGSFAEAATKLEQVKAEIKPASGSKVSGSVTFSGSGPAITVTADLDGLTPGEHGIHIHENGDCSAPDATSAGGHFNPTKSQHGAPTATSRHSGDLGNITADAKGHATLELKDSVLNLEEIVGKAVVIHDKADDFTTQPTGNSGSRVGCGVIATAK